MILSLCVLASCTENSQNGVEENGNTSIASNVDVKEFKKLIDSKEGQLLDVRTPEEVAEGYIENAHNYDIYDAQFKSQLEKLDKNKPVYVYCRSGGRSGRAMEEMLGMGFKEIYNLEGGIGAWDNAGLEKVK